MSLGVIGRVQSRADAAPIDAQLGGQLVPDGASVDSAVSDAAAVDAEAGVLPEPDAGESDSEAPAEDAGEAAAD